MGRGPDGDPLEAMRKRPLLACLGITLQLETLVMTIFLGEQNNPALTCPSY